MRKEYTCIVCPRGCSLVVEGQGDELTVTGNKCKRGEVYGRQECCDPQRMLTTTVKLKNGTVRSLPVISDGTVPKEKLMPCLEYLYQIEVEAPVSLHDVIVENILDTGVSVLAARDVEQNKI